jgi:formylglycine-generating enzyme required for sulfatase activity
MGSDARGGISFTSGNASGSKYAVRSNMGDKPVNYVSWFDAARVSNWYQNGATSSSSTETGAYTLNGATSGNAPAVNPGATFYIPTEDQWYKAAYYKGGGTNAGYWNYATQSDTAPTPVTAGETGIGSAGNTGNFANWNKSADWDSQDGNATTVGTNGDPSAYGAFDMSGNIFEWNDLTGAAGSSRGLRGGSWNRINPSELSSSYSLSLDPSFSFVGFRLAGPVSSPSSVPEIDPNSLGSVLALVLGSLGLLERRRLKAA